MRTILTFLFLMFFNSVIFAQMTISFQYDDAGNRVLRQVTENKTKVDSTGTQSNTVTDLQWDNNELADTTNTLVLNNENALLNLEVSIFPNPTDGIVNLSIQSEGGEFSVKAHIIDSNGKNVAFGFINDTMIQFDISNQPPGTYILLLEYKNTEKSWVIIKN